MDEMLGYFFLSIGLCLVSYLVFGDLLSDDVDFHYGKNRMKNRRKKQKGFWRKFLFLDIRKEVVPWHYALFWISLAAIAVFLVSGNISIISSNETAEIISKIALGVWSSIFVIMNFFRWPLYFGGNVLLSLKERRRKEYRQKGRVYGRMVKACRRKKEIKKSQRRKRKENVRKQEKS